VVREGGAGHLEAALDLIHAPSFWTGAHEQPENVETVFLSEGRKLFYPSLHSDISSIIES